MIANVNLERFRRRTAFPSWRFLPQPFRPKRVVSGQLTIDDMEEFLE